jgi:uncharacterized protein YdaT
MPWTPDRYPPAMRGLPPRLRLKAIEIANAVLARESDEGKAIRIGIAMAKQWAAHTDAAGDASDPFPAGWWTESFHE